MSLGALLMRLLLLAGIAAGAAQWWLLQRAEFVAQQIAAQWQGYGRLHYERIWVWLWGSGSVRNLSFEPTGLTQAALGTPLGYRLSIGRVDFDRPSFGEDGSLAELRLRYTDLVLPMQDAYRLRGRQAPPALAALGYDALHLHGRLHWQQVAASSLLLLDGDAQGADFADLRFGLQLDATVSQLQRAPDRIGLRKLNLEIEDRGLMPRYRQYWATRLQLSPEMAAQALIAELDRRAARERWKWDEASSAALRAFIRDPRRAAIDLDPPGDDVILKNLPLYRVGDWPQLLGLRFRLLEQAPEPAPGSG